MNKPTGLFGEFDSGAAVANALKVAGLLDDASARRAQQVARASSDSVVAVVHQLGLADDTRVVEALLKQFPIARAKEGDIPAAALELKGVNAAFLRARRALPLGWKDGRLIAGTIDPAQSEGLAALAFAANCAAEPLLMSVSEQEQAFDRLYGAIEPIQTDASLATPMGQAWSDDTQRMRDQSSAGPAVRVVDAMLERAIEQNASDIHVEPMPDRVRIRYRIDGALVVAREEPPHLAGPIAARIKVLADMDIADRRSAQDGRTSLAAKGRPIDVRISTVPSAHGETVALRLLRREQSLLDLRGLGFDPALVGLFEHVLGLRRGLFLLTGPTGSGKTTTLYAMIERLRGHALKILSIEDPIEYFFPDITQVQVNEDAGLTFPTALRSFLRQDPDVILVGEIRDSETARIALQAALTGHLVLATLHTSDAAGAIARLADMGLDRFLIAATLMGAASQRLMRKLCTACKRERPPTSIERTLIEPELPKRSAVKIGEAPGCPTCRQSGVAGRLAVGEGFLIDESLRAAIADPAPGALSAALAAQGFVRIQQAAALAAAEAIVAPAELKALALA